MSERVVSFLLFIHWKELVYAVFYENVYLPRGFHDSNFMQHYYYLETTCVCACAFMCVCVCVYACAHVGVCVRLRSCVYISSALYLILTVAIVCVKGCVSRGLVVFSPFFCGFTSQEQESVDTKIRNIPTKWKHLFGCGMKSDEDDLRVSVGRLFSVFGVGPIAMLMLLKMWNLIPEAHRILYTLSPFEGKPDCSINE